MEQAYAAIGRAVVMAQIFETALIPIFEGFKMWTEPRYYEKTEGINEVVGRLCDQVCRLRG